jgi:hypothetical protein
MTSLDWWRHMTDGVLWREGYHCVKVKFYQKKFLKKDVFLLIFNKSLLADTYYIFLFLYWNNYPLRYYQTYVSLFTMTSFLTDDVIIHWWCHFINDVILLMPSSKRILITNCDIICSWRHMTDDFKYHNLIWRHSTHWREEKCICKNVEIKLNVPHNVVFSPL